MTSEEWATIKHFKPAEFDSPDLPGSGAAMDFTFVQALDRMRTAAEFPFRIDSGIRTHSHNQAVGGVDSSAHESGLAADISTAHRIQSVADLRRFKIVDLALQSGINRIGIGRTFVHLDADPTKPGYVIWLYPTS